MHLQKSNQTFVILKDGNAFCEVDAPSIGHVRYVLAGFKEANRYQIISSAALAAVLTGVGSGQTLNASV